MFALAAAGYREDMWRYSRKFISGLAVLGGVGVGLLGLASPALADAPPGEHEVVATTTSPAPGTIMPNFDQQHITPPLRATAGDAYTVAIDSAPSTAEPGQPFSVTGHTTGFAPGNWVDVWVQQPDGTQLDDGGLIASDGSFTIPATLVVPGQNTIQLSAGAWPSEQWSAPVNIAVGSGSGSPVAVAYHDLTGTSVIVSELAREPVAGERVWFNYCPTQGGTCTGAYGQPNGAGAFVASGSPTSAQPALSKLAPNGSVWVSMTYQYFH